MERGTKIAIVTDSTADLPITFYEKNNVTMVPLIVRFGEEAYKDWVDITPKEFYNRLRTSEVLPKTSQPSVQDFIEAYKKHSDCDHIISIHLSSKLSGTYQSAYIAAQSMEVPVTVIDSKLTSSGNAILVRSLVNARDEGKNLDYMLNMVGDMIAKIRVAFYVDTLKYLEMGGRIGKASALAGSILNIKPILTLDDGVVAPLKKVKGRKRAIREIAGYIKQEARGQTINLGLAHADAPDTLVELEDILKQENIDYNIVIKSYIGSVIGTYVGPEAFCTLFYVADS